MRPPTCASGEGIDFGVVCASLHLVWVKVRW